MKKEKTTKKSDKVSSPSRVLVVGGGMGGIRTALDLAEAQVEVVLIDKANAIGGLMTQLDRTFPTNNCDLCTLSATLSETRRSRYIHLLPLTRLVSLEGKAGDFKATLSTLPRYIDLERCTACGECHRRFPECVDFNPGLDHRAPTCMRYPQSTPQAYSINLGKCSDPQALAACCPAGAIVLDDKEKETVWSVGAVVLAPGASIFDPSVTDNLSYEDPDVLTSLEYERILSASGPTQGRLLCPSDGRVPTKIAWIQCVGSRGLQKGAASYCSSACCMFALKEAMVTKERFKEDVEATIFYMDMRTFGKDYERFLERARKDYKVRLVRSRPHTVIRHPGENQVTVQYAPEEGGLSREERFDLVVLATGFRIDEEMRQTAARLGITLNEHGFAQTGSFNPVATSREGIYVCGMFESPKDIPETLVQASAAACRASAHVSAQAFTEEEEAELPPEREVSGEPPRVGVFICDCGEDIGGVISVPDLAAFSAKLDGVVLAENVGHGCSRESMSRIQEAVVQHQLNRVVIGGCSPRTHQARFQEVLRRAGLNKYLLEIANLREQDTWVHPGPGPEAALKSRQILQGAVQSVKKARPLSENRLEINRDVLVVGGGVAGMTAALSLADQGLKVFLVERRSFLGGTANLIHRTLEGEDVQAFVQELKERTQNHPNIQVVLNAVIVDHSGRPGMYRTGLQAGPQMFYRQIEHGATILATGALPNRPDLYLLGRHDAVMTQLDADALLETQPEKAEAWKTVVMIQCVGSRQPDNPNCSRVCCQAAVKNALRIKEKNPEALVMILYRDMRTYGFQEDYYRRAREQGVVFVRYEPENPPQVQPAGLQVEVSFTDPILGRNLSVNADALILSTGMISDDETTEDLESVFKVPRTDDGYFLEEHIKLRPLDLPVPGFFVAGTAHSPRLIRETIAQAEGAASRVQALLSRDYINLGAVVAKVDSKRCAACLICVRACPFEVPFINADGFSEIDPLKCQGCGVCASECPAKAIQLMQFEDDQILAKLEGLLERRVA